MSYHKRKSDGLWFVKYYENGKEKRIYTTRGRKGELEAKDLDVQIQKGLLAPAAEKADQLTFFDLAQRYLSARPLSEKHEYSLRKALNAHVKPVFGDKPATALTMMDLDALDQVLNRKKLSLATRNRYRSYCKTIMAWAENNDYVDVNPFRKFRPEKKKEGKAPDLITPQELRAILTHAEEHVRIAVMAIYYTGLRPGPSELFKVKMADITDAGFWIDRQKTGTPKQFQPCPPEFISLVKNLREREPGRVYLVEYKGAPVKQIARGWAAAKTKAGIERRLRLYDVRHLYVTALLSAGADPKAVSQLAGHSNTQTTMEIYYRLLEKQKVEAVEKLPPLSLSLSLLPFSDI